MYLKKLECDDVDLTRLVQNRVQWHTRIPLDATINLRVPL